MIRPELRLALFASLVLSSPVLAEAPQWRAADAATGQLKSVEELAQLAADFPDSASVHLRLLNAMFEAGDTDGAGQEALQLARRGYAFGTHDGEVVAGFLDPDLAAWFRSATEINRHAIEKSGLLAALPAEAQLVESVARDPKTGDLYATTVVSRALYVKRGEAEWEKLTIEGAGSLLGIAWDPASTLFWIASGNFDETPGDKAEAALLGFDPAQGKVVRRLRADGVAALGDVAVGQDGTVYVADPLDGIIQYAAPGDQGLRALVGPGIFRSPQGMAAVPGKKLLIVSDYRYGLAALDTATGKVRRIASAQPAMLDGIDGLWRYGKSLIAVQNGTSPMRIVKLDMSADWLSVTRVTVLESAHRSWDEPLGGTVADGEFLYVGTGQWDHFGKGGALNESARAEPTEIRALKLGE